MANYYEVTSIREYTDKNGVEKKQYTRLGVAFPFKDKDGFSVRLDAVPAPQDGTYSFMLFPPKPKDGQTQGNSGGSHEEQSGGSSGASFGGDINDEIPFEMEWRA